MRRLKCRILSINSSVRCRSFKAFVNVDAPQQAEAHVNENIARLSATGKTDTVAFVHATLNKAVVLFHQCEFVRARELAISAHQQILDLKGSTSSHLYFSATTIAQCSEALLKRYEEHLAEINELSHGSSALLPSASKSMRSEAAITNLKEEIAHFRNIAQRIYTLPQNNFMRGNSASTGWDDRGSEEQNEHNTYSNHKSYNARRKDWSKNRANTTVPR